jgi:cysteine desulfurase
MSERVVLDCLGEFCPMPVINLAKAASSAEPGTIIELLSDDEGSKVDIPVWCRMKGQEFVGQEDRERGWAFFVRTV